MSNNASFIPGTYDFRVWGYGTTDTLAEVLRPNYLQGARSLVHLGDLIYVSTRPGRDPVDGREIGETRVALVMVSGWHNGDASLRLVQDFGRPEDDHWSATAGQPSAAAAPEPAAAAPEPSVTVSEPGGAAMPEPNVTVAREPGVPIAPVPDVTVAEPPKRGRGRPPGSKSKPKAA